MKFINKFFLSIFIILIFSSCSNNEEEIAQKEIDRGGALIDKIIYEVRTDMTIAIKDGFNG